MQSLKLLSAARVPLMQQRLARSSHFVLTDAQVGSFEKAAKLWAGLTIGVAVPCVLFGFWNMHTREHHFHETHPDGPALPNWDFNLITKPFPWGNGKQPLFEYLFQKHPDLYPPPEKDE